MPSRAGDVVVAPPCPLSLGAAELRRPCRGACELSCYCVAVLGRRRGGGSPKAPTDRSRHPLGVRHDVAEQFAWRGSYIRDAAPVLDPHRWGARAGDRTPRRSGACWAPHVDSRGSHLPFDDGGPIWRVAEGLGAAFTLSRTGGTSRTSSRVTRTTE